MDKQKMIPVFSISFVLLIMSIVSSCGGHQKLPGNWAAPVLAKAGNCPDISGHYIGLGERVINKTPAPLILDLLANKNNKNPLVRWRKVNHISIQQEGQDFLNIVAWKDNEVLYSEKLSKDSNDFICEDGWLIIRTWNMMGIGMAGEISSTSRGFAVADGNRRQANNTFISCNVPLDMIQGMIIQGT